MILQIQNKQKKYPSEFYKSLVEVALTKSLSGEKIGEYLLLNNIEPVFSIIFTSNKGIRKMNSMFREIDCETDVLSFPMIDNKDKIITKVSKSELFIDEYENKELIFGDIVISLEKANEQASSYGHSIEREVTFLVVHSFLHLIGYDHINQKQESKMINRQKAIMEKLYLRN